MALAPENEALKSACQRRQKRRDARTTRRPWLGNRYRSERGSTLKGTVSRSRVRVEPGTSAGDRVVSVWTAMTVVGPRASRPRRMSSTQRGAEEPHESRRRATHPAKRAKAQTRKTGHGVETLLAGRANPDELLERWNSARRRASTGSDGAAHRMLLLGAVQLLNRVPPRAD